MIANLLFASLRTQGSHGRFFPAWFTCSASILGSQAMTLRFVQMLLFVLMSALVALLVFGGIRKLALSVAIDQRHFDIASPIEP